MSIPRSSIRSGTSLALLVGLPCVASCSGELLDLFGGGGVSSDSGSEGSADDKYFLVVPGTLQAIDPRTPTHVYSFGTDFFGISDHAVGGEFNPANQSLVDPGNEQLVYALDDRLFAVDLEIERVDGEVQPPEPVELAAFSAPIEDVTVEEDYSAEGGDRTYVVLVDDAYHIVAEAGGAPTSPAPFPGTPKASLMDPATGAFLGWLALDGGSLIRVDRDLSTRFITLADKVRKLGDTCDVFLAVDEQLMSYDVGTETLVDIGYTFESNGSAGLPQSVEGELYFQVYTSDQGWEICGTDLDGPVTTLVTGILAESLLTMSVLETRLVYETQWMGGGPRGLELRSVNLDGSAPVYLDGGKHCEFEFSFNTSPVHEDQVLYWIRDLYTNVAGTYAIDADGSGKTERQGGHWMGRQYRGEIFLSRPWQAKRLFWVADDPATITAVDPDDPGGSLYPIGELPPSVSLSVIRASYGDAHLCLAEMGDGARHAYFFDSSRPNSLVWVIGAP